jgi:hypothetical protein
MHRVSSALRSPLALVSIAGAAGLAWPSGAVADRSDVILAVLILAVAVTIDPARLSEARSGWRVLVRAALLPIAVLLPVAAALGPIWRRAS